MRWLIPSFVLQPISYNNPGIVDSRTRIHSCGSVLEPIQFRDNFMSLDQCSGLVLQADVITGEGHQAGTTVVENTQFLDEAEGLRVGVDVAYDGISAMDQTEAVDLAKFLSRPVRIASFTWNETDAVGTAHTYSPWNLFFNDARVKYKVNNFAFIQCKLKLKVLINASPFYYGAMLGAYAPAIGVTPTTIVNDSGTRYFIPYSQRPRMWIFPQGSKADEMTLPFFWNKNWLNIQSASELTNMGQISFFNFTALASANGVTGAGVTVQVYAWAEDVKLSGPSVGLAMQSDEYGTGVVSAPASAIASGAKWFENIPIIGRFATATRLGASAVSSIASLFGWTNVPVISDIMPYRPSAFPQLASTTIGFPAEKLTVDPKNELTVDPSVLGISPDDELVISTLAGKESYLCTATWATTNSVDDILFSSTVCPGLYDNDNGTYPKAYLTPMCWLAQLFKNWRGDIIFRFKFVATPFHKGRVRISFDPSGYSGENIISDAVSQNVVMTQIIDLGEESDVEVRLPYQQATAFLQCRDDVTAAQIQWSTSTSPSFLHDPSFDNGTITLRVQTQLTAPVATAPVPVLVFVRAAENIEFADPCAPGNFSVYSIQSDVYGSPTTVHAGQPADPHAERYLVNFGERIVSLRQLLRRQSLLNTLGDSADTTDAYRILKYRFNRYPLYFGYDPNGINSAKGIAVPGSNFPFNFCNTTPYNWLAPAFVAQRGSMQWTFNVDTTNQVRHVRVYRDNQTTTAGALTTAALASKGTQSAQASFFVQNTTSGASGQALTNQYTNAGLTVQLPNYTRFRWQTTNPANTTVLSSADGMAYDAHALEISTAPSSEQNSAASQVVWCYVGAGTDFGLYFFLNVPTLYVFTGYPTPN